MSYLTTSESQRQQVGTGIAQYDAPYSRVVAPHSGVDVSCAVLSSSSHSRIARALNSSSSTPSPPCDLTLAGHQNDTSTLNHLDEVNKRVSMTIFFEKQSTDEKTAFVGTRNIANTTRQAQQVHTIHEHSRQYQGRSTHGQRTDLFQRHALLLLNGKTLKQQAMRALTFTTANH